MSNSAPEYLSIQELKNPNRAKGSRFHSILMVRKITTRTARNNNPFLQVELGDKTGSFTFVCFNDHPLYEPLRTAPEGQIATVEGEIEFYQNRLSPRVIEMTFLSEEELQKPGLLDNLVEVSPECPERMMVELYDFIAGLGHPRIRATVEAVFAEIAPVFRESPAAVSMHHAYRHGLLEHSIHLARACQALLPLYPQVHADLALAGCLVHDIGKTLEYVGQLSVKKSRIGILQGHVVLGYRMVRKAGLRAKLEPELLERLEHIVLSHQGEMEWGAAAMAATPEAVFVSMIDNLDAKMGMVQHALRQAQAEAEFSEYLPGLKAPVLTTPIPAISSEEEETAASEDCPPLLEPEEEKRPEPCA